MIKRMLDFILTLISMSIFGTLILICIILATIDTNSFGLFIQKRIGQHGKSFDILKIKTLKDKTQVSSRLGKFFRATKLDELPQFFNILNGTMSLVGPRPDISGYADQLKDSDQIILNLKPGITGLSSIKYKNEEELLSCQENPQHYNDTIIWPDKIRINRWYAENRTMKMDLIIIFRTLYPSNFDVDTFISLHNTEKK